MKLKIFTPDATKSSEKEFNLPVFEGSRGLQAVKEVVVAHHRLRRPSDVQQYVTFLAAMVLAAQWMETELREAGGAAPLHIDEKNYFKRLREVLDLPLEDEQVRPRGLRDYEDAVVWCNWSDWIEEGGWRPTAHPGRGFPAPSTCVP